MNLILKTVIILSVFLICSFFSQNTVYSEISSTHTSDADEISGKHYEHDNDHVGTEEKNADDAHLHHDEEYEEDPHEHETHKDESTVHGTAEDNYVEHDHAGDSSKEDDNHENGKITHMDGAITLTDTQKREINLKLEKTGSGSLHSEVSLMGETKLNQDLVAYVIPRMSGIVTEINISTGDEVKKGQVLAVLDSVELAEAKSDYLEKLRQFEAVEKDFQRKKYLHEEKIASTAARIEKEAEYLNAETSLKAARSLLILSGLTKEEIDKLPGARDIMLGRYVLKAPMSGTIIERHITMGEKLSGETVIFTVADLSELWVDLSLPARDINQVRKGSKVVIESSNGMSSLGTVSLIGPTVDVDTRTVIVRVPIDNSSGEWRPGLFITGHIRVAAENVPIVVPDKAVQSIEGEDVIFIKNGISFEPVAVVTGRRDRSNVEIIAGLKQGIVYVAEGAFALKSIVITSGMDSHAGHGH